MLSDIFSVKSVNKIVDGVYNGADKAFYTDEERADMEVKMSETKMKMLELYEPFKLAQRYLAFAFTINFILAFWVGTILFFWLPTYLDGFLKLISVFQLGWIMLAIVSFYFGGGLMNRFNSKVKI